jgi:two-component sensor histidine kinase/PAS domain-containing protein
LKAGCSTGAANVFVVCGLIYFGRAILLDFGHLLVLDLRLGGRRMLSDGSKYRFLSGGGEMGALVRAFDWEESPLGSPDVWPQTLRTTVRLLLNSGHPMFIWYGPGLIQFYNDSYRETMGPERHPSALGQGGRDCWAEIWHIIGPQIDYVLKGEGSTWNEERLVPVTRNGKLENVWWTYSYDPIDGEDGGIGGVLVVCNDVTAQHLARVSLMDQTEHLRQLFDQAPGFMAVTRGPEHIFELANAPYNLLAGNRQLIGMPVREVFPDVEGQGLFELLDEVYRTGKPHVGRRTPIKMTSESERLSNQRFLDFVYAPILDKFGTTTGIFVEGVDVSDHIKNEDRLRLINEELKHRVKNTLAVVSAVAAHTFRDSNNNAALAIFQGRLAAFAKAHDALAVEHGARASIEQVIEGAVAPHRMGEGRFSAAGPPIILGSKQAIALAMAVHELGTNAIKYGALSNAGGRVDISWEETVIDSSGTFHFQWRERGGPAVVEPSRTGFGSRLINRIISGDLGGEVELLYETTGVTCRVTAPMQNLGCD